MCLDLSSTIYFNSNVVNIVKHVVKIKNLKFFYNYLIESYKSYFFTILSQ
jgi:hypothetical protein